MIIALASPCIASALDEGLDKIKRFLSEASAQGAQIVCFPEAYLPGLRGQDFEAPAFDLPQQERALQAVAQWACTYAVATILGMERLIEAGRQIVAAVIDAGGQLQGYQTKNQLDPTEDQFYVPGASSSSRGLRLAWRFATRAGAIPRLYAGRRCGVPKSSFTPTTPAAIKRVSAWQSGARPASLTTRRR